MSVRVTGTRKPATDLGGNVFPMAKRAYSVDTYSEAEALIHFVGVHRYGPRVGEQAATVRLTGWPRDADMSDLAGAQAFLHAAAATLLGHPRPDYVEGDLPDWSRPLVERFGPKPEPEVPHDNPD